MLGVFRFLLVFLAFTLGMSITGNAASFDCSKSTTETEIAICNDPELSALDEQISSAFFSIDKEGRYAKDIQKSQRGWIADSRKLNPYSFKEQLDFLRIARVVNSCSSGDKKFSECQSEIAREFENCQANENFTTLVMNRCGSAYLSMLQLIDEYETQLWRKINSYDQETLELFDIAYVKWNDFVTADCEWQYSEYRDGTIRGPIWYGCQVGHYEKRIREINGSNRSLGKDEEFLQK